MKSHEIHPLTCLLLASLANELYFVEWKKDINKEKEEKESLMAIERSDT